jgi:hypothetical protein
MVSGPSKDLKSIQLDGLDIKTLKGGFIAYYHIRSGRSRLEGGKTVQPAHSLDEEPQYLLCEKCGTVISVYPPGRIARCCDREMIPLQNGIAGRLDQWRARSVKGPGNTGA